MEPTPYTVNSGHHTVCKRPPRGVGAASPKTLDDVIGKWLMESTDEVRESGGALGRRATTRNRETASPEKDRVVRYDLSVLLCLWTGPLKAKTLFLNGDSTIRRPFGTTPNCRRGEGRFSSVASPRNQQKIEPRKQHKSLHDNYLEARVGIEHQSPFIPTCASPTQVPIRHSVPRFFGGVKVFL